MKKLKKLFFFLLLNSPHFVLGQNLPTSDTLLDRMTGKWLLKGIIAGANTVHDIKVQWILGHQYLEIKETSRERKVDGLPVYDALVIISENNSRKQYNCLWLDNTSNQGISNGIIAHAKVESNKIALLFKISDNNSFHTTLIFNEVNNTWHWMMTNEENGKLTQFADAIMSKSQ